MFLMIRGQLPGQKPISVILMTGIWTAGGNGYQPGIPHLHPAPHPAAKCCVDAGVPIISEVEFALRRGRADVGYLLQGQMANPPRPPLSGHILEKAGINSALSAVISNGSNGFETGGGRWRKIVELSSYQLEITPPAFRYSSDFEYYPDHLDRHGGMLGYIRAKEQVLASVGADGLAVLGEGGLG